MNDLTHKVLKTWVSYNRVNGQFIWLCSPSPRAPVGKQSGWLGAQGHRYMKVCGVETTTARFAWFYTYGKWPTQELEHINRDSLDCRVSNLRFLKPLIAPIPLTAKRLRDVLTYEPLTGNFTWKDTARSKKTRGKAADSHNAFGYGLICIDGITYRAHRLAWLYVYGDWPTKRLDHKNVIPSDNRIDNLREATQAQNLANTRTPRTNKSGFKGVSWHTKGQKWQASIRHNGRSIGLGLHKTPEMAHKAYCNAAKRLKGVFARTR